MQIMFSPEEKELVNACIDSVFQNNAIPDQEKRLLNSLKKRFTGQYLLIKLKSVHVVIIYNIIKMFLDFLDRNPEDKTKYERKYLCASEIKLKLVQKIESITK